MLKFLCQWEKPETCHVVQSSFMSNYHGTGPFSYLLLACWEECRAHALPCTQLQHPPPAPQQPLASSAAAAVTQNEWSRLRNVDTKGGMSFCWELPPLPPHTHPTKPMDMCIRTHTHRSTPQVQACLNTGGKKSYYDFFYYEGICAHGWLQHSIKFCLILETLNHCFCLVKSSIWLQLTRRTYGGGWKLLFLHFIDLTDCLISLKIDLNGSFRHARRNKW